MSPLSTSTRPHAPLPPIALTPDVQAPNVANVADTGAAGELSDDDLESVVGGLARTWTEALHASRPRA